MKKGLSFLIFMVLFCFTTMSQTVVYSDNFDSYTVGQQLAAQNNVNWTTWSNSPGSAEDPYISRDQLISSPNSVIVEGTNDFVLLLGDKTQGKYNLKFNMYIPSGYLGYFNVLHHFAGASSEWGLQVYFDLGGLGLVDGGGAGAGTFTFGYDQWIDVKVFVSLDEDWCDFYVNNTLVIGYQWSLGTFGTAGLNQLAGANFYAWNEGANPKYYIENVVFETVNSSNLVENFERYASGQQLVVQAVAQGLEYWTTWDGISGSTQDPFITSGYVHNGSNSVLCQGVNDFVMLFGDKTSGKYTVDFYLYIPSGKVGYYNILQAFAGSNSTWGLEIYYNPGGIAEVSADGTVGVAVFNYSYDTWIYMENIIDLNNDLATIKANGVEVMTWQWSVGASGGGINQLAAIDIYAATTNGTPYFFVDDISLTELEIPYGPPIINITPSSLSTSLSTGGTTTETLTIGNDGIDELEWSAYVQFPTSKSNPVISPFEHPEIANPVVNPELGLIKTEVTPGIKHTDETVTIHYDGDNATSVGLTNGGTFQVGVMFPASMTDEYIGMEITEVEVFIGDVVTQATLMIYGHGTPDTPGTLLAQQNFNPSADVWKTIVLTNPIMISGGDIWVTYSVTHESGLYPAGGDNGPPVPNGDWFKSAASWEPMHVANPAILLNWNIRAVANGNPMDAWLSLSPVSGIIMTGETNDVDVMFDATGLTNGTYTAEIIIISNDPAMPTKTVPVTLQVLATQLDPPSNLESVLIGNDVTLTWDAPITDEVIGYNVYRDSEIIAQQISDLIYTDFDLSSGTYTWYVTAVYDEGESVPSNSVSETIQNFTPQFFLPIWSSPYNPMTFYILKAAIDEIDLQSGDEVGIFDIDPNSSEEICVGAGVIIDPLTGGNYLEIIASMDDGSVVGLANGFTPDHEIIYKLWSEATGETSTVMSNYPYPGYDEVFASQGTAFAELNGFTTITQEISLQTGWNLMSFRVEPENWNILNIVQPLIDQGVLFKVLNETGGSIFHLPFPPPNGQWSNTIGNMANTEGYYVKVTGNGALSLEGFPVETPMDIPLTTGWNIISYPCEFPQNALGAVQPLIDAGVLYKVIDEEGGTIFHLPFPPPNGQWSNTIGNFESGKGYYVKVTGNATLNISCPADGSDALPELPIKQQTQFFQPVWENNPYMPMHIVVYPNEDLAAGDEIGVFDGEVCVGASVYNGNVENPIIVVASMDDSETEMVEGYQTGFPITIRHFCSLYGVSASASFSVSSGDEVFTPLGTSIGNITHSLTDIPTSQQNPAVKIYPNPGSDNINITINQSGISEVYFTLFSATGKSIVDGQFQSENQSFSVNVSHLNPGCYYIKLEFLNIDKPSFYSKIIIN